MHKHVLGKKEKYARLARRILREMQESEPVNARIDLTVATYALFGMMNWIYNWYDPGGKLTVRELIDNVTRLFLTGFLAGNANKGLQFAASRRGKSERLSVWRAPQP